MQTFWVRGANPPGTLRFYIRYKLSTNGSLTKDEWNVGLAKVWINGNNKVEITTSENGQRYRSPDTQLFPSGASGVIPLDQPNGIPEYWNAYFIGHSITDSAFVTVEGNSPTRPQVVVDAIRYPASNSPDQRGSGGFVTRRPFIVGTNSWSTTYVPGKPYIYDWHTNWQLPIQMAGYLPIPGRDFPTPAQIAAAV